MRRSTRLARYFSRPEWRDKLPTGAPCLTHVSSVLIFLFLGCATSNEDAHALLFTFFAACENGLYIRLNDVNQRELGLSKAGFLLDPSAVLTIALGMFLIHPTLVAADELSVDQQRLRVARAKQILSSVGVVYSIKEHWEGAPDSAEQFTLIVNPTSFQLARGIDLSKQLGKLVPINHSNLQTIASKGFFYTGHMHPKSEFSSFNFKTELPGEYIYYYTTVPDRLMRLIHTPIFISVPALIPREEARSPLWLIADESIDWELLPGSDELFYIPVRSVTTKTKQGADVSFRTILVFSLHPSRSGVPSEVWMTAEWNFQGEKAIIPLEYCGQYWRFKDWKPGPAGLQYPTFQVEVNELTSITMEDMLDEQTGALRQLLSGGFRPAVNPNLRREIHVKEWTSISPTADLFLSAEEGTIISDVDTADFYIKGIDRQESDKLLGLAELEELPQTRHGNGRLLATIAGAFVAVSLLLYWYRQRNLQRG
ncbi:MAG: hypothetical protein KatS3mg111_0772 [Pirellulaceae bacterium]|nr:MAG: hypothetical protein KatS3mg111_0772 [Pirellulaceae bacterium]